MQIPEDIQEPAPSLENDRESVRRAVAPLWHTIVLVAVIVALSVQSASQLGGKLAQVNRLSTYSVTALTELLMVGWILFGLWLRKTPFRSIIGSISGGFKFFAIDFAIAMVFWIGSLTVLGTIGIFWTVVEAAITHHALFKPGQPIGPDPSQQQTLHTLTQLAPSNGLEIAAWIGLCVIAGFAEEIIFRGYLHRQFTAWSGGRIAVGVVLSALLFGAAHGYQGARNMVLLAVFGALFSGLALFRRNLRAGIIAHSWHDLVAGLLLAFLKAYHFI